MSRPVSAHRTSLPFLCLALSIAACMVAGAVAASSKSVWSGVYTEAQAKDGEVVFGDHCAECHGFDLAGIEKAPALAGGTFGETWNKATLKKLFERIESMPPDKPKSLTSKQYAEVLAYLLSASEFPAGSTPLEADRAGLAEITFNTTRPKP